MVALVERLERAIASLGVGSAVAVVAGHAVLIGAVLLLAAVASFVTRRYLVRAVEAVVARSRTQADDILLDDHVMRRAARLVPAVVIHAGAALMFPDSPRLADLTRRLAVAYMLVVGLTALDALLDNTVRLADRVERYRELPVKSYAQVVKIIAFLFGGIFLLSTLLDRSPWGFLSGLGAMTALLLLLFKDTILGLVASVQIAANDLVRVGDWIEMPRFGADGDVMDISLTTVKVRNWDKTITTIPSYALISDAFKNWRGMSESGGRRMKRSLFIDVESVRHLDDPLRERLRGVTLIADYLAEKQAEIDADNAARGVDTRVPINGRRLTNLGTFRVYVERYLRQHPLVHEGMTLLVRQLQPTPYGLPLEVYAFSKDQVWANYEALQADIFDHLLAAARHFGLRVYQAPGGEDVRSLAGGDGGPPAGGEGGGPCGGPQTTR